jgi:Flp pilus assembly protein TadG
MRCRFGSDAKRGLHAEHGAIAVEFAIILPVLLLLVFGIVDFGHGWYMRHVLENSCREGARYATRYQTKTDGSGDRLLPSALSPSIENYVLNTCLKNGDSCLLPTSAETVVTPSGPGYTVADVKDLPLKDLTVTVTAKKYWFVLNKLVPGISGDHVDIIVATTMKCE